MFDTKIISSGIVRELIPYGRPVHFVERTTKEGTVRNVICKWAGEMESPYICTRMDLEAKHFYSALTVLLCGVYSMQFTDDLPVGPLRTCVLLIQIPCLIVLIALVATTIEFACLWAIGQCIS